MAGAFVILPFIILWLLVKIMPPWAENELPASLEA
jgi:hypothetical protein